MTQQKGCMWEELIPRVESDRRRGAGAGGDAAERGGDRGTGQRKDHLEREREGGGERERSFRDLRAIGCSNPDK